MVGRMVRRYVGMRPQRVFMSNTPQDFQSHVNELAIAHGFST